MTSVALGLGAKTQAFCTASLFKRKTSHVKLLFRCSETRENNYEMVCSGKTDILPHRNLIPRITVRWTEN